jgi:hypothetical protein
MTLQGTVNNGVVVLDGPYVPPEGTRVMIKTCEQSETTQPAPPEATVWDRLLELAGKAEGLPPDLSRQYDHYLYRLPKR